MGEEGGEEFLLEETEAEPEAVEERLERVDMVRGEGGEDVVKR